MHKLALLGLLLLTACGGTPSIPAPVNGWQVLYSQDVKLEPTAGGLWQFDFPKYPGHVNMVVTPVNGGLKQQQLTVEYEVDKTNPVWFWQFEANNICNLGSPPQMHLYFQRAGDDMLAQGDKEFYRWWSLGLDATTSNKVTVSLAPEFWTSVRGQSGTAQPILFQDAKDNAVNVGAVFGGGCFAGHGVAVKDGSAKFKLKSFQ